MKPQRTQRIHKPHSDLCAFFVAAYGGLWLSFINKSHLKMYFSGRS